MTDEEVLNKYEEMQKMFDNLPNPIHEPKRFAAYVKMYKYFKERQQKRE